MMDVDGDGGVNGDGYAEGAVEDDDEDTVGYGDGGSS